MTGGACMVDRGGCGEGPFGGISGGSIYIPDLSVDLSMVIESARLKA